MKSFSSAAVIIVASIGLAVIDARPQVHSHKPIAFGSHPSSSLHPATSTLHQHQDDTSQRFFHMQHQPAPAAHPAQFHQPAPAPHPAQFHQAQFHQPAPAPHPAQFHQHQPVHQPVRQPIFQKPTVQNPNYHQPAPSPPSIGGKGIVPKVEANPQNLLAGAGLVGAGLLAFHNVNKGNGDVSVNPTLGLNYNHKTGSFAPTLGANVQVGEGAVAPTFNIGGQLGQDGIAPVVGSGFNIKGKDGKISPSVNSGFAIKNGEAQGVVGAGIGYNNAFNFGNLGAGNVGNGGGGFGLGNLFG